MIRVFLSKSIVFKQFSYNLHEPVENRFITTVLSFDCCFYKNDLSQFSIFFFLEKSLKFSIEKLILIGPTKSL